MSALPSSRRRTSEIDREDYGGPRRPRDSYLYRPSVPRLHDRGVGPELKDWDSCRRGSEGAVEVSTGRCGAGYGRDTPPRTTGRPGSRHRVWDLPTSRPGIPVSNLPDTPRRLLCPRTSPLVVFPNRVESLCLLGIRQRGLSLVPVLVTRPVGERRWFGGSRGRETGVLHSGRQNTRVTEVLSLFPQTPRRIGAARGCMGLRGVGRVRTSSGASCTAPTSTGGTAGGRRASPTW